MTSTDTAYLVLRAPALSSDNKEERDRRLGDIAHRLSVEGQCELVKITNLAAEGTDTAAHFPVSQEALRDAVGPIWDSRMSQLFLMPDPT